MAAMHIYRDAVKEQMDVVTEGTGKRLMDYLNLAKGYEMVGHAAWIPPSGAKERIRKRKLEDGREIAEYIVDHIADVSYDLVARHLRNGEMSSFYLWDTDVPKGAAPKLIAKVEGGVFVVNDENKFKSWSTGGRGGQTGDKNLSYFKKKYAKSQ
jgi:predicted ABC-type ATPase